MSFQNKYLKVSKNKQVGSSLGNIMDSDDLELSNLALSDLALSEKVNSSLKDVKRDKDSLSPNLFWRESPSNSEKRKSSTTTPILEVKTNISSPSFRLGDELDDESDNEPDIKRFSPSIFTSSLSSNITLNTNKFRPVSFRSLDQSTPISIPSVKSSVSSLDIFDLRVPSSTLNPINMHNSSSSFSKISGTNRYVPSIATGSKSTVTDMMGSSKSIVNDMIGDSMGSSKSTVTDMIRSSKSIVSDMMEDSKSTVTDMMEDSASNPFLNIPLKVNNYIKNIFAMIEILHDFEKESSYIGYILRLFIWFHMKINEEIYTNMNKSEQTIVDAFNNIKIKIKKPSKTKSEKLFKSGDSSESSSKSSSSSGGGGGGGGESSKSSGESNNETIQSYLTNIWKNGKPYTSINKPEFKESFYKEFIIFCSTYATSRYFCVKISEIESKIIINFTSIYHILQKIAPPVFNLPIENITNIIIKLRGPLYKLVGEAQNKIFRYDKLTFCIHDLIVLYLNIMERTNVDESKSYNISPEQIDSFFSIDLTEDYKNLCFRCTRLENINFGHTYQVDMENAQFNILKYYENKMNYYTSFYNNFGYPTLDPNGKSFFALSTRRDNKNNIANIYNEPGKYIMPAIKSFKSVLGDPDSLFYTHTIKTKKDITDDDVLPQYKTEYERSKVGYVISGFESTDAVTSNKSINNIGANNIDQIIDNIHTIIYRFIEQLSETIKIEETEEKVETVDILPRIKYALKPKEFIIDEPKFDNIKKKELKETKSSVSGSGKEELKGGASIESGSGFALHLSPSSSHIWFEPILSNLTNLITSYYDYKYTPVSYDILQKVSRSNINLFLKKVINNKLEYQKMNKEFIHFKQKELEKTINILISGKLESYNFIDKIDDIIDELKTSNQIEESYDYTDINSISTPKDHKELTEEIQTYVSKKILKEIFENEDDNKIYSDIKKQYLDEVDNNFENFCTYEEMILLIFIKVGGILLFNEEDSENISSLFSNETKSIIIDTILLLIKEFGFKRRADHHQAEQVKEYNPFILILTLDWWNAMYSIFKGSPIIFKGSKDNDLYIYNNNYFLKNFPIDSYEYRIFDDMVASPNPFDIKISSTQTKELNLGIFSIFKKYLKYKFKYLKQKGQKNLKNIIESNKKELYKNINNTSYEEIKHKYLKYKNKYLQSKV